MASGYAGHRVGQTVVLVVAVLTTAWFAGACGLPRAGAEEVRTVVHCVADSWINELSPYTNYGTTQWLRCGGPDWVHPPPPPDETHRRHALLKFDFSEVDPSLPLVSATLKVLEKEYTVGPDWRQVFRIDEDWLETGEDGVTWANQPDYSGPWGALYRGDPGSWWTADVWQLASQWIGGADNYGLILTVPPRDDIVSYVDWRSRERYVSERPRIVIIQEG